RVFHSTHCMLKTGDVFQLSASDLVGHLNCRHLTDLDLAAAKGRIKRPHWQDPMLDALIERGQIHERDYIRSLEKQGFEVVRIEGVGATRTSADETIAAMKAGAHVISQGALLHKGWGGRADILLRVDTPSDLGSWSYEAIDAKLARETKGGTILQ